MSESLICRVDGNPAIGTGHVMRCLALAYGWQRMGGEVIFAHAETDCTIEQRVRAGGHALVSIDAEAGSPDDASKTLEFARRHNARWIVADGYCFEADYQRRIKDAGFRLLAIDDYGHAKYYWADYVLNQNLSANSELYPRHHADTEFLLGTPYVLLREQFDCYRDRERQFPATGRKVLVTMGGSDPRNVTGKVIAALHSLKKDDFDCVVVVGGSNQNLTEVRRQCERAGQHFRVITDTNDMPEWMAWADVAVAAGGTTTLELAFMGLPTVTIALAANQIPGTAALARAGVTVDAGNSDDLTFEKLPAILESLLADGSGRQEMSRRGRELVDGHGVRRVLTRLLAADLCLRRATEGDREVVWTWANDQQVRALSFSSEPIPWDNHVAWYAAAMTNPECFFYVASNGQGYPIGQIRFAQSQKEAVVSVSLAAEARGRGLGAALIVKGSKEFFAESDADVIHAYVKDGNAASVGAFEKANFKDAGMITSLGHPARHLVLRKQDFA